MPMWRCPHCATPQPEAARCWVCRRSSTCCETCRHFRRSVAAQLGYCGLDRHREPLGGSEIRACWAAGDAVVVAPDAAASDAPFAVPVGTAVRNRREFVPLDVGPVEVSAPGARVPGATGAAALAATTPGRSGAGRWTLFPDLET